MIGELCRQLLISGPKSATISLVIEPTKLNLLKVFRDQYRCHLIELGRSKLPVVPSTWTQENGQYLLRVQIQSSSNEYEEVERQFNMTMRLTSTRIARIERIQNPKLYEQYQIEKEFLSNKLNQETEEFLFHGSTMNEEQLTSIITNGFDRSRAGERSGRTFSIITNDC
jgi:hypothetical protein